MSAGDSGLFFRDADDVTNDTPLAATVVRDANDDGTQLSLVALNDGTLVPYGPNIYGQWSANATPVPTSAVPAPYTFVLGQTTTEALTTANGAQLAADASANAAGNELTPLSLIQVIPGAWAYQAGTGWHERFSGETINIFLEAAQSVTRYRVLVKDVSGAGGQVVANVLSAPRVQAPNAPAFVTIGNGLATNASGTIQEILITLSQPNDQATHRIDVVTGAINGGAAIANQYQLLQIFPEL